MITEVTIRTPLHLIHWPHLHYSHTCHALIFHHDSLLFLAVDHSIFYLTWLSHVTLSALAMDDADEFFDCDNEDYSAPVNDSLFDSLADGIAGMWAQKFWGFAFSSLWFIRWEMDFICSWMMKPVFIVGYMLVTNLIPFQWGDSKMTSWLSFDNFNHEVIFWSAPLFDSVLELHSHPFQAFLSPRPNGRMVLPSQPARKRRLDSLKDRHSNPFWTTVTIFSPICRLNAKAGWTSAKLVSVMGKRTLHQNHGRLWNREVGFRGRGGI